MLLCMEAPRVILAMNVTAHRLIQHSSHRTKASPGVICFRLQACCFHLSFFAQNSPTVMDWQAPTHQLPSRARPACLY